METTPLAYLVLYPKERCIRHATSIAFTENQLSLNLIGLSPLSDIRPWVLQHPRVRSIAHDFNTIHANLISDRSFSFGSISFNFLYTVSYACARWLKTTRWLMIQKERWSPPPAHNFTHNILYSKVYDGPQPLHIVRSFTIFSPPPLWVLFTFPLRYLFTIAHW
jgi:hypothetical protein